MFILSVSLFCLPLGSIPIGTSPNTSGYGHCCSWWAAFMGDRAFARARAAWKNETEAGRGLAKAEADIALSLPAEYRD